LHDREATANCATSDARRWRRNATPSGYLTIRRALQQLDVARIEGALVALDAVGWEVAVRPMGLSATGDRHRRCGGGRARRRRSNRMMEQNETPLAPGVARTGDVDPSNRRPGRNTRVETAPFSGTFYRAPSPGAPGFVEVGKRVQRGEVLCIIEATKIMNAILSDYDGVVTNILVDNGVFVDPGQELFWIEP
jgi:biotin carboxyl carrier protein